MLDLFRLSPPDVFLGKGVLEICSQFTGEYPCRNAISIKLQSKMSLSDDSDDASDGNDNDSNPECLINHYGKDNYNVDDNKNVDFGDCISLQPYPTTTYVVNKHSTI